MLAQAGELERLPPPGIVDAIGDALLEAALVHLRLLDDFLGAGRQSQAPKPGDLDDVFARHWLPSWKPRGFLTPTQRSRINAQLAHLSARRRWRHGWDVPRMATQPCRLLLRFLDELEATDARRARAFRDCRVAVEDWLAHHT